MEAKSENVNGVNVSPKRKRESETNDTEEDEEDKDDEKKRALKKRFKSGPNTNDEIIPNINDELIREIRNLMDEDDADDFDVDLQIAMCKVIREAIEFWPE